jgi:hypothetical protein
MFKSIFFKLVLVFSVFTSLISCSNDDENSPESITLETKTFSNLHAPQTGGMGQPVGGVFTKFSFSQNAIVTNDSWDIAFRGTTIVVNGGSAIGITDEPTRTGNGAVSILSNTLSGVIAVPNASTFKQDGASTYAIPTGSGAGWFNYDGATNLVTPIAGKIFVIKTHDGKYAKMEIISYYKDAPVNPNASSLSRYYTFKYVYQSSGTSF